MWPQNIIQLYQSNGSLRHGEDSLLSGDPPLAVDGDTHPAPHCDPIQQGNVREAIKYYIV